MYMAGGKAATRRRERSNRAAGSASKPNYLNVFRNCQKKEKNCHTNVHKSATLNPKFIAAANSYLLCLSLHARDARAYRFESCLLSTFRAAARARFSFFLQPALRILPTLICFPSTSRLPLAAKRFSSDFKLFESARKTESLSFFERVYVSAVTGFSSSVFFFRSLFSFF